MKVMVLGCGLAGREIVRDLSRDSSYSVTVVDCDAGALERVMEGIEVQTFVRDLSHPGHVADLARTQDLVVSAVPGWLGQQVVKEAVTSGCPVVDTSYMPEDPYVTLDPLAKSRGVTVVVDCGVAPGTSNLLVGHAVSTLDEVDTVRILGGGLPAVRRLPYEYATVFSPEDVLEEYTRPARVIENGHEMIRPALDGLELVECPGLGTLEAFNTDGLRTLRKTVTARNMEEKTLRYPGHCEKVRLLVDTGLLDEEPINVGGVRVRPRDVTAHLLTELWQLPKHETDLTVMFVEVTGKKNGREISYSYQLVDVYDAERGVPSVARTTGYACTAAIKLLAAGKLERPGIVPLEEIGKDPELFRFFFDHLTDRGIVIGESVDRG